MGKTLDVANDRAFDQSKTVLPSEVARGIYIEHPPSAQALKLMHLLISIAGGRMADDVRHEIRIADVNRIEGMRNHDRASLRTLFIQLRSATMVYEDAKAGEEIIGGFMDEIRIETGSTGDDLAIKWWFGRTFREMAEKSNHWAIIDRQTVFALNSKYAILLFQHVASLVNLDRVTEKTFTVAEVRAILGVPEDKLPRFSNLMQKAIKPAIDEINQLSRLTLTAATKKVGRTVVGVTIGWKIKADPTAAKNELRTHSAGRKARRTGTVEMIAEPNDARFEGFPESGSISFGRWGALARQHLPTPQRDVDLVAAEFRNMASKRGFSLSSGGVEASFIGFCKQAGTAV